MSKAVAIINGQRNGEQDLQTCVAFEAITADPAKFRFEPIGTRFFDAAVFIPASHNAQEFYFTDDVKNQYDIRARQVSDTLGHGGVAGTNFYLFEFDGNNAPIYLEDLVNLKTLDAYFRAHAGIPGRDITRFNAVGGDGRLAHGQFTLTYMRDGNVNGRAAIMKLPVVVGLTPLIKPVRKYLYIYKRLNGALVFLTSNNKDKFPSSVALMYKRAFAPGDTGLVFAAEVAADLSLTPLTITVALNGVSTTFNNLIQGRSGPSALITGVQPSSPRKPVSPSSSGVISAPLSPRSAAAAAAAGSTSTGLLSPRSAAAAAGTSGFGTTAPQSSSTSTGITSPRSAAANSTKGFGTSPTQSSSTSTGLTSPRSATANPTSGFGTSPTQSPSKSSGVISAPHSPRPSAGTINTAMTATFGAPVQSPSKSSGVISAPHSPRAPVAPVANTTFGAPVQTSPKSSGVISAPLSPRSPVAPVTQSSSATISTPPQSVSMLNPSSPVKQPAQSAKVVGIPVPISVTKVGTFVTQPNGTQTMMFTQPPASASGFGTAGSSFGDLSSAFRQLPKGI